MLSVSESNNIKMSFTCLIESVNVLYMSHCVTKCPLYMSDGVMTHDISSTCLLVSGSVFYISDNVPQHTLHIIAVCFRTVTYEWLLTSEVSTLK